MAAFAARVLCAQEAEPLGSSPQTRAQLAQARVAAATCPAATGRNFAGQNLADHNFHADPPGSLRGANFEGANLKGAVFEGQDLTGAVFKKADLGPSSKGSATFAKAILDRTCFVGATLNATDFTYARFACTDFSDTSLLQAEFGPSQDITGSPTCRTSFVGATIDVNAIETEHWGKVDFSFAAFANVSPQTFNLAGVDITNARLAGANFSGIDLTGANLTGVDFKNGKLINAKMANTALNGIDLSGTDLSFATLTCARFYGSNSDDKDNPNKNLCTSTPASSAPRVAAKLIQATLSGADLTNATLNSAVLRGASLAGATLRRTSFIDAWLEPEGNILATSFLGADLTSANFTRAHANQVQFDNVLLSLGVFEETTLNGTSFAGSILPQANFNRAILQSVSFRSAVLQGAKFRGTTLQTTPESRGTGVSFACAHLGGADFTAAVMPPETECCPEIGGGFYCGLMDGIQQTYGAVIFPVLQSPMPCPNATVAKCKDAAWMIPNWRTTLCNRDRTEETVWRKPDCGTSPRDYVVFSDKKLESCILDSLPGKPAGITVATAGQITHVSCPGKGITSIGGLEKFTRLVSLDLTGNQLGTFDLSAPIKTLQTLKIGG
ncbi:MAG: pentapeptide repeat-containing protein, partial [Thermoanaerobaculia bacterium]